MTEDGAVSVMVIKEVLPDRFVAGVVTEGQKQAQEKIPIEQVPEEALEVNSVVEFTREDGEFDVTYCPDRSEKYDEQLEERKAELRSRFPTTPDRFDG